MKHHTSIIAACVCMSACTDWAFGFGSTTDTPPPCDEPGDRYYDDLACDPCYGDPDRETLFDGGDTGEAEPDLDWCTPLTSAQFIGAGMYCGGEKMANAEHCSGDAVELYHLTDFDILDSTITALVKYDFVDIDEDDPAWPIPSEANHLPGVPGIVQHPDNYGGTDIAFMSRGCCHQHVHSVGTDSTSSWIPHHPDCMGGAGGMRETPLGWCAWAPTDDGGLCVFPCSNPTDCPDPASMFCDLASPDPMGQAPGTCRFEATPMIPTPFDQVGAQP